MLEYPSREAKEALVELCWFSKNGTEARIEEALEGVVPDNVLSKIPYWDRSTRRCSKGRRSSWALPMVEQVPQAP